MATASLAQLLIRLFNSIILGGMDFHCNYPPISSIIFKILFVIIMSKQAKPMGRIFGTPTKKTLNQSLEHSSRTSRRKPIFSAEKYSTQKKDAHPNISVEEERREWKLEAADFLKKMMVRIESKNKLLKQLEQENAALRRQNQELEQQNEEVGKKLAVFSGLEKLKQKNNEYRTKIVKASALLEQLKRSSSTQIKGIDDLIRSLRI